MVVVPLLSYDSIRIEGQTVSLSTVTVNGGTDVGTGGLGRIAIYYRTSLSGYNCTAGNSCYSKNTSLTPTPTVTGTLPTPTLSPTPTSTVTGAISYTYGNPAHVHAVTNLSNNNSYVYDANGNTTQRVVGGVTWNLTYNVENRTQSLGNGTYSSTYVYDSDGVRVGQNVNGVLTYYFMGGAYEVTVNGGVTSIRKYYSIAGQMVAMDDGSSLQYFLTDHLGSMVGVVSAGGTLLSEQRYLPSGETRNTPGITQTDFGYTGQRALSGTGLMDFRARIDDPYLNRFLQPDSIIPNLYNPQSLNRFSYVGNNPINRIDPSGHKWTCMGANDDHCYDDGNFNYSGGDGGLSGMALNKKDRKKDQYSWQKILYNMDKLGIYGNAGAAMNYVASSECTKAVCTPGSPLFKAMSHKYNQYCDGGNTWSETCVQSFWGYPEGVLTGNTGSFPDQKDMAAAILDQTKAPHGGFSNDGHGCGQYNGVLSFCGWANFIHSSNSQDLVSTLHDTYTPSCELSNPEGCGFISNIGVTSFWIYPLGGEWYFIVMDYFNTELTYCNPPYNYCGH